MSRGTWSGPPVFAEGLILGATLLTDEEGAYELAEQLAREALEVRRRALPEGDWLIAEAQSIWGGCLAELGGYEEAEGALLRGYAAMKNNPRATQAEKREALERIVKLYETWGKPEQAAKWRAESPTTQPAPAEGEGDGD